MADLIFNELTLRNFKGFTGFHKLSLDKPGLYHVAGVNKRFPDLGGNGVGKSTIFDALKWVLFGKTGRDGKPGAAVVPWKIGKSVVDKSIVVGLDFCKDGNEYYLERTRNPNSLHLWKIGKPHDEERELVQDDIPKLIGMSEELFCRTILLSQNSTLFLDLTAEKQAQMFSEALDLNVWLVAAEKAAKEAKALKWDVEDLTGKAEVYIALAEKANKEIAEAQKRADAYEDDRQQKLNGLVDEFESNAKKLVKLKKALGSRPSLPTAHNERISKLLTKLEREPELLRDEKVKLEKRYTAGVCSKCGQLYNPKLEKALGDAIADSDARMADWRIKLRELQDERAEEDENYKSVINAWQAKEREVIALEVEQQARDKQITELEKATNPAEEELKLRKKAKRENKVELNAVMEKLEGKEAQLKIAEFWVKAFKEIRLSIIDEVLFELEIAANRHAELLGLQGWEIKFETERETASGNISYRFSVLLFPPGQNTPVKWESYSGGESQRWQLAVTFALSEVLLARAGVSPNVEVLDEPTRGLSAYGIDDLLNLLSDRALELERSIWFVDHHSLDRGSFYKVLRVTKDKEGSWFQWQ